MIEEGRAYALAIAMQHLLRHLERKGVLNQADTTRLLDASIEQLNQLPADRMDPESRADGARTLGLLYCPTR
ncbi:hypothetical protein [Phenylobacterium sp.]|uniref:hypothetical protein n=1 Tax=Phenylobacterium sp. TaxID=1871053 RepID=UPI0035AEA1B8